MKNQEIKGKSGLVLEKLSENELEIITAGMDSGSESVGFDFLAGLWIPFDAIGRLVFGPKGNDGFSRAQVAGFLVSSVGLSVVLEVICYGVYKCGSAVVRKLRSKPVSKVASDKTNVVSRA